MDWPIQGFIMPSIQQRGCGAKESARRKLVYGAFTRLAILQVAFATRIVILQSMRLHTAA